MNHQPRLLITAGPTHEPIDRVRYIGNRSSGRMGIALAEAALALEIPATLLLGPVEAERLPDYSSQSLARFRTAADLQALLKTHWPAHDILLMAAAVADYRARTIPQDEKLRRGDLALTITLDPVPDLLTDCAINSRPDQVLIGFALEPANELLESAKSKLARKGIDAIVANPLETLGSDHISGSLVTSQSVLKPPQPQALAARVTKREFARWLIGQAVEIWSTKNNSRGTTDHRPRPG